MCTSTSQHCRKRNEDAARLKRSRRTMRDPASAAIGYVRCTIVPEPVRNATGQPTCCDAWRTCGKFALPCRWTPPTHGVTPTWPYVLRLFQRTQRYARTHDERGRKRAVCAVSKFVDSTGIEASGEGQGEQSACMRFHRCASPFSRTIPRCGSCTARGSRIIRQCSWRKQVRPAC